MDVYKIVDYVKVREVYSQKKIVIYNFVILIRFVESSPLIKKNDLRF